MATNKTVTVTSASVVTNDTLASYNVYSDQDGLLDNMTPAEAAAGHVVSLSDGVSHSVTVKPVGTSNGEFSAVTSNAVTVDLSGGSTITFEDDFTGTVIDTAKWTVTNTTAQCTITQNGNLIFDQDGAESPALYDCKIVSDTGFALTGIVALKFDINNTTVAAAEANKIFGLGNGTHNDSVVIQRVTNDASQTQLIIKEGGANTYVSTVTANYTGTWKILIAANGDTSFWRWNGASWTQAGVTTATSLTTGTYYVQGTVGGNANSTFTVDNVKVADADFATENPV